MILRVMLCLFVVSSLLACAHKSQDETAPVQDTIAASQDISQAQQFYAQREDLTKLRTGIATLRQALTKDPGSFDAAWQLAKFNYYLATHTQDTTERDNAFQTGIEAGKQAVELQHEKPDGHFWLGANYGGAAEQSSIQGLATVNDIKTEMETVLKLNEGYQDGSAYMVLGLVYLNAPSIVGGDPNKAVELMEKGLKFGEPNAFLHLHLAEAYAKVGRKEDARKQLETVLSMQPDQNYLPEYKEASDQAHKLLDQLKTD